MKVKIDIISGFLGAGKTTLIKKLLEEKLYKEKVVIIENEFGEIGIDGNILKKSGIEVKEINSGCICCTLAGDFEKSIREVVAKYRPDRILIEPSGVGKLSDVIKACEAPKLKDLLEVNLLITVVDVQKYTMYAANFGEFFENQISNAKTVILSRTQNVDLEKIEAVTHSIRTLNSKACIMTTPWESLHAERIISAAEQDPSLALEQEVKSVHPHEGCRCGCHHAHHPHLHNYSAPKVFSVWSAETPRVYPEKELSDFFHLLEKDTSYGMVLRGKGVVQLEQGRWVQFDYVPGEFRMKDTGADYTGRLCIIGRNLKKDKLSKRFRIME